MRTKVDSLSQQNHDLTNKVDSLTQKIDLMTLKLLGASVVIIVLVIILIAHIQNYDDFARWRGDIYLGSWGRDQARRAQGDVINF